MYLSKNSKGKIIERPQHMYLRVALWVTKSFEQAVEYYNSLSKQLISHYNRLVNIHAAYMGSVREKIENTLLNAYTSKFNLENITAYSKTIKELKGDKKMTNNEKFEGLKKDLIKQNSIKYKDEVVSNWGEYKYNASIDSIKSMTVETFQKFQKLESDIIEMLIEIKKNYDETLEKKVAQTHQDWIKLAWGVNYTKKLHLEVSDFYIQDERFKHYYEKHGEGLARILRDAIYKYLDN
jgi:DNA anti-recombination protein RmuC